MYHFLSQGRAKVLSGLILLLILCGDGIHLTWAQAPETSPSSSGSSEPHSNSGRTVNNKYDNHPQSSHQHPPVSSSDYAKGSVESSIPARAVSTRPSSDMSTTPLGESDSVPSHYDACPNSETWCSSLDENEKLALEAIHALHHQLDDDKNGNIDLFESNEFLREELKYDRDYEKRQENFHRNNDNQVSVRELWETWVRSEVHNWTVEQTAEWIGVFVGLPQYQDKFNQLVINGTYLPRLAVNHHNFLTTNLGIKDVITRQKLTLKAQDVVLFGPPRDNTNHTKDAILTTLLVVAVTVCYLVYCRYKSSQRDLSRMSKDMEALMQAEENLRKMQKELEQAKCDQEIRDKEAVPHRTSSDDEDELIKLREEVIVLRNELQRAEVELQDKCWVPPPALTHWLQLTYELESKAHNKKRLSAEKQLKQAKEACDKLKKKRSSLMGAFVATHARSIDDVDKAILEARAALTEVTQELQERMHRWKQIEFLVKSPIVNNPGLTSLEILLRTGARSHPYLGAGSVMSNSQDDIDDDGASSIYCPSAVHKLVSTSAFMIFPGQNPFSAQRSYQQQASSDYSSLTNLGGGDSCRPSQSPDMARKDRSTQNNSQSQPNQTETTQSSTTTDFADYVEVSGPLTNMHTPIARSKSVQSMLSLRDRGYTRESSSKDSSNGEEDVLGDAAEMTARDRRVTFRAAADRRSGQLRSLQGRTSGPIYEPTEFEESRNLYSRKPLSANKSSEEESSSETKFIKEKSVSNVIHELESTPQSEVALVVDHSRLTSDLQTQTSEPNLILLNNKTPEKSPAINHAEESSFSPPKLSLFKTISKLMRLQSDGLTSKKTKKPSTKDNQQQNADSEKPFANGNTTLSLPTHNSPSVKNNNLITEKNLLPLNIDEQDNSQSSKHASLRFLNSQKKSSSSKFFASLRRSSKPPCTNSEQKTSS